MLTALEQLWNSWLQLPRSRIEHLNTVIKNHAMFNGAPFRGWVQKSHCMSPLAPSSLTPLFVVLVSLVLLRKTMMLLLLAFISLLLPRTDLTASSLFGGI